MRWGSWRAASCGRTTSLSRDCQSASSSSRQLAFLTALRAGQAHTPRTQATGMGAFPWLLLLVLSQEGETDCSSRTGVPHFPLCAPVLLGHGLAESLPLGLSLSALLEYRGLGCDFSAGKRDEETCGHGRGSHPRTADGEENLEGEVQMETKPWWVLKSGAAKS